MPHPIRRLLSPGPALKAGLLALLPLLAAGPAHAYIGPGAGLTAIGTALALVSALFLAVVGFVWYPVRRLLRKRRAAAATATAAGPGAKAEGHD